MMSSVCGNTQVQSRASARLDQQRRRGLPRREEHGSRPCLGVGSRRRAGRRAGSGAARSWMCPRHHVTSREGSRRSKDSHLRL